MCCLGMERYRVAVGIYCVISLDAKLDRDVLVIHLLHPFPVLAFCLPFLDFVGGHPLFVLSLGLLRLLNPPFSELSPELMHDERGDSRCDPKQGSDHGLRLNHRRFLPCPQGLALALRPSRSTMLSIRRYFGRGG